MRVSRFTEGQYLAFGYVVVGAEHQDYFFWAPGDYIGEAVLGMDGNADDGRRTAGVQDSRGSWQDRQQPWAMPWEQRMHIYLRRDLNENLGHFWPKGESWLWSEAVGKRPVVADLRRVELSPYEKAHPNQPFLCN